MPSATPPISAGGWKLPLIDVVMLVPLILSGPGKLSLDAWLARAFCLSK